MDRAAGSEVWFRQRFLPLVLLVLPILAPFVFDSNRHLSLLGTAAVLAMLATSLNLVFGYGGILSGAHGAFWGVGAFAAGYANLHWGWDYWTTAVFAIITSAMAAILVGLPSFRTSGAHFLIITFAFGEFMHLAERNLDKFTGGVTGIVVIDKPPAIGPVEFGLNNLRENYFLALGFVYLTIFIVWWIRNSRYGAELMAVRDNEDLARSVGINSFKVKLIAFVVSAALAGLAGNVYLYQKAAVSPDLFGSFAALQIIVIVIVGGTGTTAGPAIGAFFLTFLPEFLDFGPKESRAVYGVLLVLFILLLPRGAVGTLGWQYQALKTNLRGRRIRWPRRVG